MPDDKEELQEEKNYWMKQWEVILVSRIMVALKEDADDHLERTQSGTP